MVRGKLENPFKCPPNMFKILIYGWRVEIGLNDFVQQVECSSSGGRWEVEVSKGHCQISQCTEKAFTRAFSGQIRIN